MRPTEAAAQGGADLDRRDFLRGAAVTAGLPLIYGGSGGATAARAQPAPEAPEAPAHGGAGMIRRERNPDNLELPFSRLDSFLTPNAQFYVRTHFEVPVLEAATWKVAVGGAVERALELSYDELRGMPARTITALLECSGNGRVFLDPPQLSIRWELGGVGNAAWTGVPLADVLERAGLRAEAVEVILEGADTGQFRPPLAPTPGVIPYARSLALAKACRPDEVILAYQMNGEDLPPRHGYPVRAVVAGWYGMASVKWLRRILVADRPFHGYFQTFAYATWDRDQGLPSLAAVTDIPVKSQIARPAPYEVVPKGVPYRVFGAAWAGEALVTGVELSTDGGGSWAPATLLGAPVPFAWRLWEFAWTPPDRPEVRVLMARATDNRGRTQPLDRDPDRRDAVITHVLPIEVEIR